MGPRRLEIRANLETAYADVLTQEAVAALEALAGFDADRKAVMAAPHRAAGGAGSKQAADQLPRSGSHHPANANQGAGRPGRAVHRRRDSHGPPAPMDSGHRPGREAQRPRGKEHPQRRLRAAVRRGRLDVRRRGRARPGVDDVAGQPAQPQAGHPSRPRVHEGRRTGGGRDEPLGAGFLRAPDHRRLEEAARLHDQDLSAARAPPRRPAHPADDAARASPPPSST